MCLPLRATQGNLAESIRLYFSDLPFKAKLQKDTQITCWKGRKEKRTVSMSADPEVLAYLNWSGITHVWEYTRMITRKGETTTETALGIASFPKAVEEQVTAMKLNHYIRGHWGIENGLHRTRDVAFHEDKATIRKGKAPQVMAALKNLVISILHRGTVRSFKTAFRRFAAHPEELFQFLGLTQVQKTYLYA